MKFIGIGSLSWLILTALRVGVFFAWSKVVGENWPRGHWVLLTPQIVLIFAFSFALLKIFPSSSHQYWLGIGACWLVLTLAFEFIGVLVFEKGTLALLFEGWKIWKGNIWTLVLLSHLFAPYLLSLIINRI